MPTRELHYCELVEIGQHIQKRELSPWRRRKPNSIASRISMAN